IVDSVSGAAAPYAGYYIPEGNLNVLKNLTAARINGTWTLRITDNRSEQMMGVDPTQFVADWSITFNSGLTSQTRHIAAATTPVRGAFNAAFPPATYPIVSPVSPDRGIGPGVVVAADNTLGSASPFAGRLYIAYVDRLPTGGTQNQADNTDISLVF